VSKLDSDHLIELYPQLFHMAEAESWPSIREHGLMTTDRIVQTAGISDTDMTSILGQRRSRSVTVDHPLLGRVVIRDQGPLNLAHLRLTDMTFPQWIAELNSRVFFWLHSDRLQRLLNARRYRLTEHDVITLDTRRLLASVKNRASITSMNTGATLFPSAPARGSTTFTQISDYDYEAHRRQGAANAVVELAVSGGVPDLRDHVIAVHRMRGGEILRDLEID
jgi:hypothetical protein